MHILFMLASIWNILFSLIPNGFTYFLSQTCLSTSSIKPLSPADSSQDHSLANVSHREEFAVSIRTVHYFLCSFRPSFLGEKHQFDLLIKLLITSIILTSSPYMRTQHMKNGCPSKTLSVWKLFIPLPF